MIELGAYTTTEFKKALNIPTRVWNERREELFEYLEGFFDFEIKKRGRETYYIIKGQYTDYVPLPKKVKSKEIVDFYFKETKNEIKIEPWNTGSNIARIIVEDKNKYNHAQNTAEKYVRGVIKKHFLPLNPEKQWMKRKGNKYIPLNYEEISYLEYLFRERIVVDKLGEKTMELIIQVMNGYLSKEDIGEAVAGFGCKSYMDIMMEFKGRFGFIPIRVNKLELDTGINFLEN